jgi:hypothetical protein
MCPLTGELPGRRGIRAQPGRWWRLCAPPMTCPGTGSWARAERSNCGAIRQSSKGCDSRPRGLRSAVGVSTCACTSISSEEQGALRRANRSGSERVAGGQRGDKMQCRVAELRSAGQTRRPPPRLLCWLTPCILTMRTGLVQECARHTAGLMVVNPRSAPKERTGTWGTAGLRFGAQIQKLVRNL